MFLVGFGAEKGGEKEKVRACLLKGKGVAEGNDCIMCVLDVSLQRYACERRCR